MKVAKCFGSTATIIPKDAKISVGACTCHHPLLKVKMGDIHVALSPKQASQLINDILTHRYHMELVAKPSKHKR